MIEAYITLGFSKINIVTKTLNARLYWIREEHVETAISAKMGYTFTVLVAKSKSPFKTKRKRETVEYKL